MATVICSPEGEVDAVADLTVSLEEASSPSHGAPGWSVGRQSSTDPVGGGDLRVLKAHRGPAPSLHEVSIRIQSSSPPLFVPGVVRLVDISTCVLRPDVGSTHAAWVPAGRAPAFTEMVREVGR